MAERRLRNRRLSNRRSSNNVSGFLNENTNLIETNDPLWYDRSIVRPSTSFNLTRNETSVLNSDSTINASQYSDTWFKNLTQSDVSTVINNDHNIDKHNSSHADPSTESESDSQRKRAKFGLNKRQFHKKNQSLRSNAFLQALEKTTDSKSNYLNAEELLDGNQSESTNDESRTIKKIRPMIFRRKKLLKSRESNFHNVFEDDKSLENNDINLSNSKGKESSKNGDLLVEKNSELQQSKSKNTLNESKSSTRSAKSNVERVKDSSKIFQRSRSRITLNESNMLMSIPESKVNEDNETQASLKGIHKKRSIINSTESNISSRSTRSATSKLEDAKDFSKNIQEHRSRITQHKFDVSNRTIQSMNGGSDLEEARNSPKSIEKNTSNMSLNNTNISNGATESMAHGNNLEVAQDSLKSIQRSKSRISLNKSSSSNRTTKSMANENNLVEAHDATKIVQNSKSRITLNKSNIPNRSTESEVNGSNSEEAHGFPENIVEHRSRITLNKTSNISNSVDHSRTKQKNLEEAQDFPKNVERSKSTMDLLLNQSNIPNQSTNVVANDTNVGLNEIPNANVSLVHNSNKLTSNTLMNPRVLITNISTDKNVQSSLKNMEKSNFNSSSRIIENKNKRTKLSVEKISEANNLKKSNAEKSNLDEESGKSVETSSDGPVEQGSNDPLEIDQQMSVLRQDANHRKFENTPKVSSKMLRMPRMSNISDYFLQTPKPAQSTMNLNGRPLMNITQLSFSSSSSSTKNDYREAGEQNQQNVEDGGEEEVDVVHHSDENLDNIPMEIEKSAAQSLKNLLSDSRAQKTVNPIENTESIIPSSAWEVIKRKTDAIKAQTRARMNREAAIEKEIKLKKLRSEANLRRILAKQEVLKKKLARKPVDKAYLVNGKPYKQPKLPRPMSWASDRLYKHLWKCMESKFGIKTRIKSEQFMVMLADTVKYITSKKKYENYKDELEELMITMAKYNIIKTRFDFHRFCSNFLPYSFRIKVVPMMLPGNIRNIPYNPDLLYKPIIKNKNENSMNNSFKQHNNRTNNDSSSENGSCVSDSS